MRTFGVMYDHTFSKLATHQVRCQATQRVGCQPGDCILSLKIFLRGLCRYVCFNILTLSPLRDAIELQYQFNTKNCSLSDDDQIALFKTENLMTVDIIKEFNKLCKEKVEAKEKK